MAEPIVQGIDAIIEANDPAQPLTYFPITQARALSHGAKLRLFDRAQPLAGGGFRQLIDSQSQPLVPGGPTIPLYPVWSGGPNDKAPSVQIVPRSDGFDLIYTFDNAGLTPASGFKGYGSMWIPGLMFENQIRVSNTRHEGKLDVTDALPAGAGVEGLYPGTHYAPVSVLVGKVRGDAVNTYAMGLSVVYDVPRVKHYCFIKSLKGSTRWHMYVQPNPAGEPEGYLQRLNLHAPVGTSNPGLGGPVVYRLAFRITRITDPAHPGAIPNEWLRTIEAYREHFMTLYGPPTLQDDKKPLALLQIGAPTNFNPPPASMGQDGMLAPYRLDLPPSTTPLRGWPRVVQAIKEVRGEQGPTVGAGYDRVLLWCPAGVHNPLSASDSPDNAFQFTSHWSDFPANSSMLTEISAFRTYASSRPGKVGLYWGHAMRPTADWFSAEPLLMDRLVVEESKAQLGEALALKEFTRATGMGGPDAGATLVGLDDTVGGHTGSGYLSTGAWEVRRWHDQLSSVAPGTLFIYEPDVSDLIHQQAPMLHIAVSKPFSLLHPEFHYIESPHVLANFLLPGRGIYRTINQTQDWLVHAEYIEEASRVTSMGYSLCAYINNTQSTNPEYYALTNAAGQPAAGDFIAADVWEQVTPAITRSLHSQMYYACSPADIADDEGQPRLWRGTTNTGVNEGDYNAFFVGFFNAAWYCDVADDAGRVLARFNGPVTGGPDGRINEGDYNAFFQAFFRGCR